jgi:hypothetical protein
LIDEQIVRDTVEAHAQAVVDPIDVGARRCHSR